MEKTFEWLEKIEQAQGTNNKKRILISSLLDKESFMEEYLRLVYNDDIYNVSSRRFEKIVDYDNSEPYFDVGELMQKKVFGTIQISLEGLKKFLKDIFYSNGNDKLYNLSHLTNLKGLHAKWVARLIMKDLKIGIKLKSINDVFEDCDLDKIDKFEVQLCGTFKKITDYNLGFPVIVAIKYDGERCVINKKQEQIMLISRQGKLINYVPELFEHFKKFDADFVLDGEIVCQDFSTLQKRIGRKSENIERVKGLKFIAFDVIQFNNVSWIDERQKKRMNRLKEYYANLDEEQKEYFGIEENIIVNNIKELEEFYKRAISKAEGVIIKLMDARYYFDSRHSWFKVKPFFEDTFIITGKHYGTGKKAGLISSVNVKSLNETIKSKVGTGFSDNDIITLMNLDKENKLIGTKIDVSYQEITTNKFGNKSLRFPAFIKWRFD